MKAIAFDIKVRVTHASDIGVTVTASIETAGKTRLEGVCRIHNRHWDEIPRRQEALLKRAIAEAVHQAIHNNHLDVS